MKPKVHVTSLAECAHRQKFWSERKWDVEWISGTPEQLLLEKKADVILIDPIETAEWIERSKNIPIEISRYGFADSLWLQEGRYWPRALTSGLLRDFVVQVAKTLDISAWAYIVGGGPWAQMFVYLASDIGYRKICLVADNPDPIDEIFQKVKKHCFGLETRILAPGDLTQEPNNGSLLINTLNLESEPNLLQNLLYLNFVHKPGLIMDIHFEAKISALLGEARQTGFEIISGVDIRAVYDHAVIEKLNIGNQISLPAYLADWRAFLGVLK